MPATREFRSMDEAGSRGSRKDAAPPAFNSMKCALSQRAYRDGFRHLNNQGNRCFRNESTVFGFEGSLINRAQAMHLRMQALLCQKRT